MVEEPAGRRAGDAPAAGPRRAGLAAPEENPEAVVREARAYLARRGLGSARKACPALEPGHRPTDAALAAAARDHVVVRVAVPAAP